MTCSELSTRARLRSARRSGAHATRRRSLEIYASMPRVAERLLAGGMDGLAISRLLANFAEAATGRAIESDDSA